MLVFDTKNQRTFRDEPWPSKAKLPEKLRELVGGDYETLPHKQFGDAPFTAYANAEGMLDDLPSNFLPWGVLRHLGFEDSTGGLCFYFGNIVLIGKNDRPLNKKQREQVDKAMRAYANEMGEDEVDDGDDIDDDNDDEIDFYKSRMTNYVTGVIYEKDDGDDDVNGTNSRTTEFSRKTKDYHFSQ